MVEHHFFLAVKPKAAARTNVTCRGSGKRAFPTVYTAPGYRGWLDEAIPLLQEHAPTLPSEVRERDVRIDIEVVIRKPKSTKRLRPGGDSDNYEKGVWDAMTKVGRWWVDDEQIVENHTVKRWASDGEPEGYHVRVQFMER
jgi:Holliday junction resolvase RusA-like endonuclease